MSELILPPGVDRDLTAAVVSEQRGMIVNETDLPDAAVQVAVESYFDEHSSALGIRNANMATMPNRGGSILARGRFQTPTNVYEEIILARDLAERDDDVAPTMGMLLAAAFGAGMQHNHEDETTIALFDEIARVMNLDSVFQELYRELLIASSVTTATLFTREEVSYKPSNGERTRNRSVVCPRIGILPAENILPMGNDMFGTATLWYRPMTAEQEEWLREFFSATTTAARKAEMKRQDPVLTSLLIEERQLTDNELRVNALYLIDHPNPATGEFVYRLNPRLVKRTTLAKGAWQHPRPLMTRNFPLLEAKRLLNLMDYALLEGGANFLVVAKKGSDAKPAMPAEVANLREQLRKAARAGVLVGDHRVSIEIITPDLGELLNSEKRALLSRKLAKALMRVPDMGASESTEAALIDAELLARVIESDRLLLRRHVEGHAYSEAAKRNAQIMGAARVWFPKVILQGTQYFTDYVLKLSDRGALSRKSTVEAGGFSYDAEVQQRRREKSNGDDKIMIPPSVQFGGNPSTANGGAGRPVGGSKANGAPGSQPGRSTRDSETVRAMVEDELAFRCGEVTFAVLEEYASSKSEGRLTARERAVLSRIDAGDADRFIDGSLIVIPVNTREQIGDASAVRLAAGLSMLVGRRAEDDAIMARALVFREPEFTELQAEELALRWGFDPGAPAERPAPAPDETAAAAETTIVINVPGYKPTRQRLIRDPDTGAIIGSEPVDADG